MRRRDVCRSKWPPNTAQKNYGWCVNINPVNSFSAIFGETPHIVIGTIDVRGAMHPKKRKERYCNNNVVLRVFLASGRSLHWRRRRWRQQQTVFRGRNVYNRDGPRRRAKKWRTWNESAKKKKPISRSAAAATAVSYLY